MKLLIAIFGLLNAAVVVQPIVDDSKPLGVTVGNFTFGGLGCPAETAYSFYIEQEQKLVLEFEELFVQTGQGLNSTDSRKSCNLNIELVYPKGWSFAVSKVEYFGFLNIPKSFTAIQSSKVFFTQEPTYNTSVTFAGPKKNLYDKEVAIEAELMVWSKCGSVESLNVQTTAELLGDENKDALMSVDFDSGRVRHLYSVEWKKCEV